MEYQVVNRPKLARNKYGEVENKGTIGGANSLFSPTSSSYTEGGNGGGTANIDDFVGSTATEDGIHGLVPAPQSNVDEIQGTLNDNVKFLKGNGAWVDIPISRYTEENVNKDGVDLDGNLTISDTLTTQTLNVLGSAHFWELVIDKVRAAGGNLLITPANFVVDYVGSNIYYNVDATQPPFDVMFYDANDGTGILGLKELFTNQSVTQLIGKRLYMKNSDGSKTTTSEFVIGDMVRCKTLNLEESNNLTNKDYWTFVLATGTETYNSESCLYIDVLYQYVANGTTYGLGTSIQWQDTPIDTHLTYYEDADINDEGTGWVGQEPYKVFIATSDKSSGNCEISLPSGIGPNGEDYEGTVTWDGEKWNFSDSGTSIYPNTYIPYDAWGNTGYIACLYDDRFTDPVLKVMDKDGYGLLGIMSYAYGNFYIEDYVEQGSSTTPLLESFKFGYGTFTPETGDNIVSLGHLWNGERQSAILISSYDPMDTELKAPAIAQYRGIRTFSSISPYRTSAIADNGNVLKGSFLVDYNGNYIDVNERINLFTTDITTGLERVGIHLDGENSTIKMVGSVEVRQNGIDDIDTLTVWDEDGKMRVKISPEAIPTSAVNNEVTQNFTSISGNLYPDGTVTEHHTWTEFIWSWNHQWQYYTSNGKLNFSQYLPLGNLAVNEKISVSDLKTTIYTKAMFKGTNYTSERGTNQSISSVTLRLQRNSNGSNWVNVTSTNITSGSNIDVQAEKATISNINTIFDNRTITTVGVYRLTLEIVFNIYASITFDSQQSNPSFVLDTVVNSSAKIVKPTDALTIIGRDGIVFHTDDTGEYFMAGNNGIKIKWGDAELDLSDADGFRTNFKTTTINASTSKYLQKKDCFVVATDISQATNLYLPSASTYGVGRVITIIGNDYITLRTNSNSEYIYTEVKAIEYGPSGVYPQASAFPFNSSTSFAFSTTGIEQDYTGEGVDKYYRTHNPLIRLVCSGSGWYLI